MGCWTCRMRRKKCDEKKPACNTCKLLHIPCYGYGERPYWMDGGTLEKHEIERVKSMVKKNNIRKRQRASTMPSELSPTRDALAQTNLPRNSTPNGISTDGGHSLDNIRSSAASGANIKGPSQEHEAEQLTRSCQGPTLQMCFHCGLSTVSEVHNEEESRLLMHYLDIVFPQLFRFYNPLVSEGGRGWLLTILVRTKPLFHAALSLSAYHRKKLLAVNETNGNDLSTLPDLERHHMSTLVELRRHIDSLKVSRDGVMTMKTQVEVLACMIHLISFEVSPGHTLIIRLAVKLLISTKLISRCRLKGFQRR
jgi:hypothetical protein